MTRRTPDNHQSARTILRVLGVLFIIAGVGCIATAIIDFFTFDSFQGPFGRGPTKFFLFFIGGPLLVVGAGMANYGFMGAVAKYQSQEITPVVTETFNHLAEGTKQGLRIVSKSIAEGYKDGALGQDAENSISCAKCLTMNDADSKFCKTCGHSLASSKVCMSCNKDNDPDAAYCTECGGQL